MGLSGQKMIKLKGSSVSGCIFQIKPQKIRIIIAPRVKIIIHRHFKIPPIRKGRRFSTNFIFFRHSKAKYRSNRQNYRLWLTLRELTKILVESNPFYLYVEDFPGCNGSAKQKALLYDVYITSLYPTSDVVSCIHYLIKMTFISRS